ncbi:hypothetical protein PRIPAC_97571 [Pristionchus pacificus]|uniref:Uncharacterized protein n=1 Tax=Pristionchus pacificus TaxID=54126 RepID=A0A454XIE4_PRIPA|nr:hypothetical protein PRIPAC_97571 [Pristionchus pacificus]|eukprot:PDM84824.1 hypothetical protein PRIPAC_33847 [Pristionchus pacificus]
MSPLTALLFLGLFSVVVTSSTEAQGGEKARVCGKKLEDTILDITKNCEKERSQYAPLTASEREQLQKRPLIQLCCAYGCSRRVLVGSLCYN